MYSSDPGDYMTPPNRCPCTETTQGYDKIIPLPLQLWHSDDKPSPFHPSAAAQMRSHAIMSSIANYFAMKQHATSCAHTRADKEELQVMPEIRVHRSQQDICTAIVTDF